MSDGLKTWTTPLGVNLTVGGKGGPWVTITPHEALKPTIGKPLEIPLPPLVDKGWYYRNWRNP